MFMYLFTYIIPLRIMIFFIEIGSHIAQVGLKLTHVSEDNRDLLTLLSPAPECCGYKHELLCSTLHSYNSSTKCPRLFYKVSVLFSLHRERN